MLFKFIENMIYLSNKYNYLKLIFDVKIKRVDFYEFSNRFWLLNKKIVN